MEQINYGTFAFWLEKYLSVMVEEMMKPGRNSILLHIADSFFGFPLYHLLLYLYVIWYFNFHLFYFRRTKSYTHGSLAYQPLLLRVPPPLILLLRTLALQVRHQAGGVRRGREALRHQEEHGPQPGAVRRNIN